MTTAHTAGPWTVKEDVVGIRIFADAFPVPGEALAQTPPFFLSKDDPLLAEMVANARLIAAAPELLAAVEAFLAYDADESDHGFQFIAKYEEARILALESFAKATGAAV